MFYKLKVTVRTIQASLEYIECTSAVYTDIFLQDLIFIYFVYIYMYNNNGKINQ